MDNDQGQRGQNGKRKRGKLTVMKSRENGQQLRRKGRKRKGSRGRRRRKKQEKRERSRRKSRVLIRGIGVVGMQLIGKKVTTKRKGSMNPKNWRTSTSVKSWSSTLFLKALVILFTMARTSTEESPAHFPVAAISSMMMETLSGLNFCHKSIWIQKYKPLPTGWRSLKWMLHLTKFISFPLQACANMLPKGWILDLAGCCAILPLREPPMRGPLKLFR